MTLCNEVFDAKVTADSAETAEYVIFALNEI